MPKLWTEHAEVHRRDVRGAILDATAALVAEYGLHAVTIPAVAGRAGIDRAALERCFPDVDAILLAWHERQIGEHLAYLDDIRDQPGDPFRRLDAVLRAFAAIVNQVHRHQVTERGAALHEGEHLVHARRRLHEMIRDLLADGIRTGHIRDDVPLDDLATHCMQAMSAAGGKTSAAAVRQLITDTLAGLRHP